VAKSKSATVLYVNVKVVTDSNSDVLMLMLLL